MLRKLRKVYHIVRDPDACGTLASGVTGVAYIPWWPSNPYQSLLKNELASMGFAVHDGALDRRTFLCLLLGRGPAQVVHIHWPHGMYLGRYARFPFVLAHLLLYRLLRNNIVWTVHELEFYETRYPVLDRIMIRFLMVICRALIVHSRHSARCVRERYGFKRQVMTVLHPSYVGCYPNTVSCADARAALGIDRGSTVYLFLGHIKPYKGVEHLIEVFKRIGAADCTLLIAGQPLDVETEHRIRALSAGDPRIRLELKYVPDEDVQTYMQASDAVVFPFRRIHTSGSVLLAMSFGKAVIVPAMAAIPEYVDEQCAILFDPAETRGLEEALMAARVCDLDRMGQHAYERAAASSWKDFAEQHAVLYRTVVGASNAAAVAAVNSRGGSAAP